jgi:hypothetical protein
MNINGICPYETPCGWCSKWDKKCDNKISITEKETSIYAVCEDCVHKDDNACLFCSNYNLFLPKGDVLND